MEFESPLLCMKTKERVERLELMVQTLAKACNYTFPDDSWPLRLSPVRPIAEFKEHLREEYWKTYPQGDYLFEDFLVEILYKMKKAADK